AREIKRNQGKLRGQRDCMGCGMSDDKAGLSQMDQWRRTGGLKTDLIEGELQV
ncbi:hypothetical protein CROQUDRAFT_667126, partial [Cronartium quercuum f. sp. fusiforme G11]